MGKITDESLSRIDNADLERIMAYHGHNPVSRDHQNILYSCPFHSEKTPSFKISTSKRGGTHNSLQWKCFGGCENGSGHGAIALEARLAETGLSGIEYINAAKRVASICNITIDEIANDEMNGKKEFIDPQDHYTVVFRDELTIVDLEALGCRCVRLTKKVKGEDVPATDESGKPLYKYSFGDGGIAPSVTEPNFYPNKVTDDFGIKSVEYYITPKFADKNGKYHSIKVSSTPTYPILSYVYDGGRWGRMYQPYYRKESAKDSDRRFFFWYLDGKKVENLNQKIYGTTLLMSRLEGKNPNKLTKSKARINEGGLNEMKDAPNDKFQDLIICSGGSDAINVYYHHNKAQVCWINSENATISFDMWKSLNNLAKEVYVLFDIDDTGKKKSLEAGLLYLDLRVIFLPDSLKNIRSSRTGKPCKDAKDYFSYYNPKSMDNSDCSINVHFKRIINSSLSLRFWIKEEVEKKKETKTKYSIDSARLFNFLASQGLFRYVEKDSADKIGAFVLVKDNKVEYISEKSVGMVAQQLMVNYIKQSWEYDEDLLRAILNSPRINPNTMQNLPSVDLNFNSWSKELDHFFFKNTAVRITKDKIEAVPYSNLGYNVNRMSIQDSEFRLETNSPFSIKKHPKFTAKENEYLELKKRGASAKELLDKKQEIEDYAKVWKYKLDWNETNKKNIPFFVQFLYNIGRIHWRKEKEHGEILTEEEKQEQDMHFINKVCAIGFSLSRYRSSSRPYMVFITEANVRDEGKPSGGTGKSLFIKSLDFARKSVNIDGKSFDPKKGPTNFQRVMRGVTTHIHLEDIDKKLDLENLYVMASSGMVVRALYTAEVALPKNEAPILLLTSNYLLDFSADSTLRRLFLVGMSDYYHSENPMMGIQKWTPEDDGFGDMEYPDPSQLNGILNFMAKAVQFYMNEGDRIMPPMKELSNRALVSTIGAKFVEWANDFFSKPHHFNTPIDRTTMFEDYLDFKELSNFGRDKSALAKFKADLQTYCNYCHYTMNPPIIFQNDSDKKRKELRVKCWCTITLNKSKIDEYQARTLIASKGALYFCKQGEEPKTVEEIGKAPEVDPDPILDDEGSPIVIEPTKLKEILTNESKYNTIKPIKEDLPF